MTVKNQFDKTLGVIHHKFSQLINNHGRLKLIRFFYKNILSQEECYITCSGKRDGIGAQALAVMSTMLFAEKMHIKYVHTPFTTLQHNYENDADWEKKWEIFFNLGNGELKRGDSNLKISKEISLDETPLIIKKQANTLFILRHCHEYADMFPNQYSRINSKLVEKYYISSKAGYELHYDPQKVNIAVHIRRGDVNGDNQFKDKFTGNKFIVDVLSKILDVIASLGKESSVCIYSEGKLEEFRELERTNLNFFLNISPFTTFHNLVCADILVLSKSTFSYTAALLSNGIKLYIPFRHKQQNGWIKINEYTEFDTKILSMKLKRFISDRQ